VKKNLTKVAQIDHPKPHVIVNWRSLQEDDDGLDLSGCLYAMTSPDRRVIVYLGKAWRATVAKTAGLSG
jgi:hypothetical protein